MKRIKYLLMISVLACMIGCQNQNDVIAPIENSIDENVIDNMEKAETESYDKEPINETTNNMEELNPYQEYYNFVSNYNSYEWEKTYSNVDYGWDSFQLVELDGDEYPELVATNVDPHNRFDVGKQCYLIVDFYDNTLVINEISDGVASAGGYRGEIYYIPEKGIIYERVIWAYDGTPSDTVYVMEDGKVIQEAYGFLKADTDYKYPDNLEKGIWYWNDKVVTKEEYNKNLNDATNNLSGNAFCEIDYQDKDSMLSELFELYNNQ